MLGVRLLPGKKGSKAVYGAAEEIGVDEFDSYHKDGVYAARRSCQVLPCFVMYY